MHRLFCNSLNVSICLFLQEASAIRHALDCARRTRAFRGRAFREHEGQPGSLPPISFYARMPRMSALKLILWAFLAGLVSVALDFVVGLVNPKEKVNGLWLVVAAACIYVLAFRFYGRWISRRVVELNDQRVTPAMRLNDGVNFH